jgi:anti-sigma B factor antagonist
MEIQERTVGPVIILDLQGKLVLGDGDDLLKDKINSLIFQGQQQIILNLGGVPYMDSAGLGQLIASTTAVASQGGRLRLLNVAKRVQDLLSIVKLLTVFDVYTSEADAVKGSGGPVGL